jgi:hypothetical protein
MHFVCVRAKSLTIPKRTGGKEREIAETAQSKIPSTTRGSVYISVVRDPRYLRGELAWGAFQPEANRQSPSYTTHDNFGMANRFTKFRDIYAELILQPNSAMEIKIQSTISKSKPNASLASPLPSHAISLSFAISWLNAMKSITERRII